jgi:hypothetical protein
MNVLTPALIIQRRVIIFMRRLKSLSPISFNNKIISYSNINSFLLSERKSNDKNNKIREMIISAIINSVIPNEYYLYSSRWSSLRKKVLYFVSTILKINYPQLRVDNVKCVICAGRGFNHDFTFTINEFYKFNIELKFNAYTIEDTPQFVSPMKPSQYLSHSYEEFYYIHYITQLSLLGNFQLPEKDVYLREIHSPSPDCMKEFQNKYYKGCIQSSQYSGNQEDICFYEKSKELSKESIRRFIEYSDLDINKLSAYLISSQNEKYYMLYKDNDFHVGVVDINNYKFVSYEKYPEKSYYLATSLSGKKIRILLRWKNGNGIAFPSFQISLDTTSCKNKVINKNSTKVYKSYKITKPKISNPKVMKVKPNIQKAEPKNIDIQDNDMIME